MLSGSIDPHYTITGFLVGALVGVTGVGGGSLMTPILIVLFGVSPATAVGTDLLFAAATKTVGSLVHGFNRTIDWRVVRRLATGSIPTSGLALIVLSRLDMRAVAQIVGSDIAHAVPLTLIAGLGYGVMGSVDLHALVSLLTGSLSGIFVGSSISARVPDTGLRYLLAAVLIVVGSKLLIDVSAHPRANVEAARMTQPRP